MPYKRFTTSMDEKELVRFTYLAKLLKTTRSGLIELLFQTANIEKLQELSKLHEKKYRGRTSHNVQRINQSDVNKWLGLMGVNEQNVDNSFEIQQIRLKVCDALNSHPKFKINWSK